MKVLLRKEEIGNNLGISLATVNNWIRTHVIPPPDMENYYSRSAFDSIIGSVKNTLRLHSRANRSLLEKKHICYLGITDRARRKLLYNLVSRFEQSGLSIEEGVLALAFAVLRSNNLIEDNWGINGDSRTDVLLSKWMGKSKNQTRVKELYSAYEIRNNNDDMLGAFYQSIQSVAQKSRAGSYYTPPELLHEIIIPAGKTVLDPCCGSGGILLKILSRQHDPSMIFAGDTDGIALKICFVNLALFFNDKNIPVHIIKQDIAFCGQDGLFAHRRQRRFDYIVTNPPWGSKFTKQQKKRLAALYPKLASSEIFSIALYNAINALKQTGQLYFFLPCAFLNVAAHRNIRKLVFKQGNTVSVKLLGDAFTRVLSESILLHIHPGGKEKNIFIQNKEGQSFYLSPERITAPDYTVIAANTIQDTMLMEKIYAVEHITLKDNTVFGIGIVTGSNKSFLLKTKTGKAEAIYRGMDIQKYAFTEPEYFMEFCSELYQQTAPEEYYRQKKIVYRFIGDKLVCVLDDKGSLILNSANFFIPGAYPIETVVSLFNSGIYTYIFRKKFYSKKVLKSHLQHLPLPLLPGGVHRHIYDLYHKTFDSPCENIRIFQSEIDGIICGAFKIDATQYSYIKEQLNAPQASPVPCPAETV